MSGHTPGPWTVHSHWRGMVVPAIDVEKKRGGAVDPDVEAREYAKVIHERGGSVYPEFYRSRVMREEAVANARLIAAAPDLLDALRNLYALVQGEAPSLLEDDHHDGIVRRAIAKAKTAE